jgi:transposase
VLARVRLCQCAEGLSDRQAGDGVRARSDWKYARCLPREDAGCDAAGLREFRARRIAGGAERRRFETLREHLKDHALVKPRGRQRTDAPQVLTASQVRRRLAWRGELRGHARDTRARVAPAWLRPRVPTAWFARDGQRFQDYRLPSGKAARTALAAQIGAAGRQLLVAIHAPAAPTWLRAVPAVRTRWRC